MTRNRRQRLSDTLTVQTLNNNDWRFIFCATILISLNYCVVVATYSILVYVYAKIEYVSVRTYPSTNRIRTLRTLEPCRVQCSRQTDVDLCSIGMPTSKVNELMWFFNVGLSGKDGMLYNKWRVKTLETVLKENNHMDVMFAKLLYWLAIQRVISRFGSVFRWDYRWVLNSDWDQRYEPKSEVVFFVWSQLIAQRFAETKLWTERSLNIDFACTRYVNQLEIMFRWTKINSLFANS